MATTFNTTIVLLMSFVLLVLNNLKLIKNIYGFMSQKILMLKYKIY